MRRRRVADRMRCRSNAMQRAASSPPSAIAVVRLVIVARYRNQIVFNSLDLLRGKFVAEFFLDEIPHFRLKLAARHFWLGEFVLSLLVFTVPVVTAGASSLGLLPQLALRLKVFAFYRHLAIGIEDFLHTRRNRRMAI